MKYKVLPLFALMGMTLSTPTLATNGYQLIGIGGYQKSLAGAVTAKPGSAMTAITNPAGMARIGKRTDFSLEMFMPDRFVDFTSTGGAKSESAATQYGVPALGWTAPVEEGNDDVFFGGGIYGTSGLGADYPQTLFAPAGALGPNPDMNFEGYSAIQFWQMAPTLAWNVDKQLTLGVSLNIDYQSVAFKQTFKDTAATPNTLVNLDLSRTAQAFGLGLSFGLLYDVNDQVTIGASYKSEQNFGDLEYQLASGDIQDVSGFGFLPMTCPTGVCPAGTYKLDLDFPQIFAVGVAYTPIKSVTLSFDIKQITWSDTLSNMVINGPNGEQITLNTGWDDQTIIALGIEYALNERVNLRAGYNKADAPFGNAEVDNNLILPATTESHFAIGADWHMSKTWELGFHASKATENTLTSPAFGSKIGLKISTVGINLGYHF